MYCFASLAMTISRRGAALPEFCSPRRIRNSPYPRKKARKRSAERCIQPSSARRCHMLLPESASGAAARSSERARLSALHRGACPGDRTPGLNPGRASHDQRHEGATFAFGSCLSGAPRAPVFVPAGTMPGPPGSRVTSPARRNRTRSIDRLSPATSLHGRADFSVTETETTCQ